VTGVVHLIRADEVSAYTMQHMKHAISFTVVVHLKSSRINVVNRPGFAKAGNDNVR
jgi:hypothetical protein